MNGIAYVLDKGAQFFTSNIAIYLESLAVGVFTGNFALISVTYARLFSRIYSAVSTQITALGRQLVICLTEVASIAALVVSSVVTAMEAIGEFFVMVGTAIYRVIQVTGVRPVCAP